MSSSIIDSITHSRPVTDCYPALLSGFLQADPEESLLSLALVLAVLLYDPADVMLSTLDMSGPNGTHYCPRRALLTIFLVFLHTLMHLRNRLTVFQCYMRRRVNFDVR